MLLWLREQKQKQKQKPKRLTKPAPSRSTNCLSLIFILALVLLHTQKTRRCMCGDRPDFEYNYRFIIFIAVVVVFFSSILMYISLMCERANRWIAHRSMVCMYLLSEISSGTIWRKISTPNERKKKYVSYDETLLLYAIHLFFDVYVLIFIRFFSFLW